jgi:hypothetical protein
MYYAPHQLQLQLAATLLVVTYAPPFVAPAYERPVDALASWHECYAAFNQPEGGQAGAATRTSNNNFFSANQDHGMQWFDGDEEEQAYGLHSPDPYVKDGMDVE